MRHNSLAWWPCGINLLHSDNKEHSVHGGLRRIRFRSFKMDLHSSWDIFASNIGMRIHQEIQGQWEKAVALTCTAAHCRA